MNCKFCNGELPEDVTLCPACGGENVEEVTEEAVEAAAEVTEEVTEEAIAEAAAEAAEEEISEETVVEAAPEEPEVPKQKPKVWLVILAVIGAVALLAVLVGAVIYGINSAGKTPESYTVSEEKAVAARDTVVATAGDVELTNSELQIYYWQSVNEFYEYYSYYMDPASMGLDLEKPLDQQFYDEEAGITWQQYFLENALSTWSRYAALSMQAKEDGFTLSEDVLAYVESVPQQLEEMAVSYGYASTQDMLNADMGAACDETGYMNFLNLNMYAGQYLDSRYETLVPTTEEIEAYYLENQETLNAQGIADDGSVTTDVRHILICPKGGTEDEEGNVTYSEAEWEACRMAAQQILDTWQAGDKTEESFAALATEHTEDPGSMSTGGLYTDVYVGQMVAPFEDWCFDESRQYGDTGLVQTNYGYHVMYFVDSHEIWVTSVQDTIINERTLAIVNDAVAKWPMEANYKKIVLGEAGADAE